MRPGIPESIGNAASTSCSNGFPTGTDEHSPEAPS